MCERVYMFLCIYCGEYRSPFILSYIFWLIIIGILVLLFNLPTLTYSPKLLCVNLTVAENCMLSSLFSENVSDVSPFSMLLLIYCINISPSQISFYSYFTWIFRFCLFKSGVDIEFYQVLFQYLLRWFYVFLIYIEPYSRGEPDLDKLIDHHLYQIHDKYVVDTSKKMFCHFLFDYSIPLVQSFSVSALLSFWASWLSWEALLCLIGC